MKSYTLKPFEDKGYVSEEEALKLIEKIPIPGTSPDKKDSKKDNSDKKDKQAAEQPDTPDTESSSEPITLEGRIITIDSSPADADNTHVQDEWIKYFNDNKRIMVSMPDLYQVGKAGNKKLIENLRKDFTDSWEISSTRIIYNKNDLNAKIIHYFNSKETKPIISNQLFIPVYQEALLNDVLNTKEGLFYLQTLFGTKDNANQIKDTLHKLSNYSLDKTKVWSAQDRFQYPARASGFDYLGEFRVDGSLSLDDDGRSRGVLVSPR